MDSSTIGGNFCASRPRPHLRCVCCGLAAAFFVHTDAARSYKPNRTVVAEWADMRAEIVSPGNIRRVYILSVFLLPYADDLVAESRQTACETETTMPIASRLINTMGPVFDSVLEL